MPVRELTLPELARRLYAARRAGVKLDLGRMRGLLDALEHPERGAKVVLIGGTNGKGSTVAFAASIARASGLRVGAFTSPHLSRLAERFAIDGQSIDDDAVLAAGTLVEAAVEGMRADPPTFFERVTAMALVAFADAAVELILLEVGLGGRFDATNAVDAQVAVVTGVALDHQDYLGQELAQIAREKAGIFRAGRPALIGRAGLEEGRALLQVHAESAGASPVTMVDAPARGRAQDWSLGLDGSFQRDNAACALALIDALGISAGQRARREGLAAARLPGRFERLDERVTCDGAHNPHGAHTLARELTEPVVFVVGVSEGKDVLAMARALAPKACAVIATRSRNPRAMEPGQVAQAFRSLGLPFTVDCASDLGSALMKARLLDAPIVVCGSLFVVAEAREALGLAKPERLELSDPL